MPIKSPKNEVLAAVRAAAQSERDAVEFLELHRWGGSPSCPRCGDLSVYQMRDAKTGERNRDNRWRCRGCKQMYTVRTNTVMEESRLPLRVWLHCYWRACASKKGVSALQISRECEVSYKSALFLMHRLREAMADLSPDRPKLSGTVEADETYVGGKPRFHQKQGAPKIREKRTNKTPVVGIVERGGNLRLQKMERVSSDTIKEALADNVDPSARLYTDESRAYLRAGKEFSGGHETVNHGKLEYVRGDVHSNTIEGAFSLLKRGIYGTFHSISKKHMHRYLYEFEFRHNARKVNDGERLALAIKASEGKRLTYRQQIETQL